MQEESPRSEKMHSDLHILRVGYQDRANFAPLMYPVEAGWVAPPAPWKVESVRALPGELADMVLDGGVDAAFVPPQALAQHGDELRSLGGWGLVVEGKAE